MLAGFPVVTSVTCPADTLLLLDAADFIIVAGDTPNFIVSDQVVLHMEDTSPLAITTPGAPATFASPVRSLFQTDSIAVRMILDLNWTMRRTTSVQWTDTTTWAP